jgi:Chromo (CHRromatin Organisation MOdifier) domain
VTCTNYLPLAKFAFNDLENSSTHQTPFFANLAYHPTFEPQITKCSTVPAAEDLAQRLAKIHAELHAELEHTQTLQAKYYNERHLKAPQFVQDQFVWLLRRNIKTTRPSDKLDHRRLGPYRVIDKISSSSYLLNLPSYLSRLHPVFHVSLLEPYHDPSVFHSHSEPEPFQLADDSALNIHSIYDARKIGHQYEYFVRWKNQPESKNSWIPLSNIPTSHNKLLDHFHRCNPHPHTLVLNQVFSPLPLTPPTISPHTDSMPQVSLQTNDSLRPRIPPAAAHPASPLLIRQRLRSVYKPAARTMTHTDRVSRPATRYDPELH